MDTTRYQEVHGAKPKGDGLWTFQITATDGNGAYTTDTLTGWGIPSEARKEAVSKLKFQCARIKSIVEIELLP